MCSTVTTYDVERGETRSACRISVSTIACVGLILTGILIGSFFLVRAAIKTGQTKAEGFHESMDLETLPCHLLRDYPNGTLFDSVEIPLSKPPNLTELYETCHRILPSIKDLPRLIGNRKLRGSSCYSVLHYVTLSFLGTRPRRSIPGAVGKVAMKIPLVILRFLVKYKSHIVMAVAMIAGEKVANTVGSYITAAEEEEAIPEPEPIPHPIAEVQCNTPLPLTVIREMLQEMLQTTTQTSISHLGSAGSTGSTGSTGSSHWSQQRSGHS
jgi:hypothetical protein